MNDIVFLKKLEDPMDLCEQMYNSEFTHYECAMFKTHYKGE